MKWRLKRNSRFLQHLTPDLLVKVLLRQRGIKGKKAQEIFLNPPNPEKIELAKTGIDLEETAKARVLIKRAKEKKEKVIIYGDYDADGLCSTALVWEALYFAGIPALPYIPDRVLDNYGLNAEKIDQLSEKIPGLRLVITVDNGIVAFDAIRELRKRSIDVIVVDHHLRQEKLPTASAIIHTTDMAASGVAWFFLRELAGLGVESPDLGLAALGTVADMLPMTGENRSLVKYGAAVLETTKRFGLRHLFTQSGIEGKPIDAFKMSYVIAPRLNALGRIGNPLDGLRLLCSRRPEKGESLARLAEQVNAERHKLTIEGLGWAKKIIADTGMIPSLLFISSSQYHQGIIGLIAGKLAEEYGRPAVVIKEEAGISHGSARSVEGLNIVKLIRGLKSEVVEVGGHPMAAGFKIKTDRINSFHRKLTALVAAKLPSGSSPSLTIDAQLPLAAARHEYFQAITRLAPFGLANPSPFFVFRKLRIGEIRKVGAGGEHLKLWLDDPETPVKERIIAEAIGFNLGEKGDRLLAGDIVDIVATIDEDNWNGRSKIVLKMRDLKLSRKMVE